MATQLATFAGGCFWCTEAIFQQLKGVVSVRPGYAGGSIDNPSYEQVSAGTSGHAEAIQFEFDPEIISYRDLLDIFWHTHDPTTINRQGNDIGPQYRSVVFYHDEEQKQLAEELKTELDASGQFSSPIVTTIEPFSSFYVAEDYHFNYYNDHKDQPYCQVIINPKLQKLREKYSAKLAE